MANTSGYPLCGESSCFDPITYITLDILAMPALYIATKRVRVNRLNNF